MKNKEKRYSRILGSFFLAFVLVVSQIPFNGWDIAIASDQDEAPQEQVADRAKGDTEKPKAKPVAEAPKAEPKPEAKPEPKAEEPKAEEKEKAEEPKDEAKAEEKSDAKADEAANEETPEADAPEATEVGAGATEPDAKADDKKLDAQADDNQKGNGKDELNLAPYIGGNGFKFEVQKNGTWYEMYPNSNLPAGTVVNEGDPIRVNLAFRIGNAELLNNGAHLYYSLPDGIQVKTAKEGNVKNGEGDTIGTFQVKTDGTVNIYLKDDLFDEDEGFAGNIKSGKVTFQGAFKSVEHETPGQQTIKFGDITINVPVKEKEVVTKETLNISKTANSGNITIDKDGKAYIDFTIKVSTPSDNTKKVTNVTVKDAFTAGGSYVDTENITADTKGVGTFDVATMTWSGIPDMDKNQSYTMTLHVPLKDSVLADGNVMSRTVTNKAQAYSGTTKKNEASASSKASAGVNVSKKETHDKAAGTVSYTIVASAPATNSYTLTNVTADDVFSTNKKYVKGYKDIKPGKGTTTKSDSGKTLNWNIGTLAPGESVTLTYTVDIDPEIYLDTQNSSRDVVNRVDLKVNGTSRANASAKVNYWKHWVYKGGQLQSDGRVRFEIHANETKDNKGGNTTPLLNTTLDFKDTLKNDNGQECSWVYDGVATVNYYNQGPDDKGALVKSTTFDIDGKTSWEWSTSEKYYMEIIYYAKLKESVIGKPTISNEAGVGVGYGGQKYYHKSEWSGNGGTYDAVYKQFDGRTGNIASWTSKIEGPVTVGATYTDYSDGGKGFTFTQDQINGITVSYAGANLVKGTDYSVEAQGNNKFVVSFLKEFKEASKNNPITITYQSTLNTDGIDAGATGTYKNTGVLAINGHTDSTHAECTYVQDLKFTKSADTYDKNTHTLYWLLKLNQTGSMNGSATITENIPEGTTFTGVAINTKGANAGNPTVTDPVISADGKTVTFDVNGLKATENDADAGKYFVELRVATQITDEKFLMSNTKSTFVNKATLTFEGKSTDGSATQEIENKALDKQAQYDEKTAPNMVYTVKVNQNGIDMLKDKTVATVEDVMDAGLIFKEDTLKVTNSKTGAAVAYSDLVVGTTEDGKNFFRITVPDDQPLDITYECFVSGEIGEHLTVTNTVKFYGTEDTPGKKEETVIDVVEAEASADTATGFALLKKNGADTNETLAGAEFTLFECDLATGQLKQVGAPQVTPKSGKVTFNNNGEGLDKDTVYAYAETKAPEGFEPVDPKNLKYKYIAFKKKAVDAAVAKGFDCSKATVAGAFVTLSEYNYKGQIELTKQFEGDVAPGSYYFGLFNEAGTELVPLQNNANPINIEVVANSTSFKGMFRNVPFGTYSVYETDADGKKLQAEADGSIIINGQRYIVDGQGTVVVKTDSEKVDGVATGKMTIKNTSNNPQVKFTATKDFKNATNMKAFDFVLTDVATGKTYTASNDTKGVVDFDKTFKFTEAGDYTFTVKEVVPEGDANDGITYDTTEHTAVVTIAGDKGLYIKSVKVDGKAQDPKSETYALIDGGVFTNTFNGKVELYKVDTENAPLAGATFELHKADGSLVDTKAVDKNGYVAFENLVEGSYYIIEKNPPKGYAAEFDGGNLKKYEFEIGWDGKQNQKGFYSYTVPNTPIQMHVTKTDLTGKTEVAGATLELRADGEVVDGNGDVVYKDGAVVKTWTSADGKDFDFGPLLVANSKYVLTETVAPTGYGFSEDINIVVAPDGTIAAADKDAVVTVKDAPIKIGAKKTDENGDEMDGAQIAVFKAAEYAAKGDKATAIDSWTTEAGKTHDFGSLLNAANGDWDGKYVLVETGAPEGYGFTENVELTVNHDGTIDAAKTSSSSIKQEGDKIIVTLLDKTVSAKVNKYDVTGKNEVAGATLALYNADANGKPTGDAVDTWTSVKGENKDFGPKLKAKNPSTGDTGAYVLVETNAPSGFGYSDNVAFTVNEDGTVTSSAMTDGEIAVLDNVIKLEAKKVDTEGNEVEGAKITVFKAADYAASGNEAEVVDTWTSAKGKTHDFGPKLDAANGDWDGKYILVETGAPNGLGFAESVPFVVTHNGTIEYTATETSTIDGAGCVITVTLVDKTVSAKVNKYDLTGTNEVEGAVLALYNADAQGAPAGRAIAEWTSEAGKNKDFGPLLKAEDAATGDTGAYVLVETDAPAGYGFSANVNFKVNHDGTVTSSALTEAGEIAVLDDVIKFEANKTDFDGNEVDGAKIAIFKAADYAADGDKAKAVASWTSKAGETYDFGPKLEAANGDWDGKYVLVETGAPNGFGFTENVEFTVNHDGTIDVTPTETSKIDAKGSKVSIVLEDKAIEANVNKYDVTGTNEVEGATLALYGLDAEGMVTGDAIDTWTSVKGENHDFGSLLKAKNESTGDTGEYLLTETDAPTGFGYSDDVYFTVNHDGTITSDALNAKGEIAVLDTIIKLEANKVDLDGNEVEGAEIVIYKAMTAMDDDDEAEGPEVVDSWTSKIGETHDFGPKLDAANGDWDGKYILVETGAPNGFGYTESVEFTVNHDGSITVTPTESSEITDDGGKISIVLKDKKINFDVNKVDLGGEEVAGATMAVFNAADFEESGIEAEPVDSWISVKGETHNFGPAVKAENETTGDTGEYVLAETNAPTGYTYAEPVAFKIKHDGTVIVGEEEVEGHVVIDKPFEVYINKKDIKNREIDGAVLGLYANEDIYDKSGKLIYPEGKELVKWTSVRGETFNYGPYLVAGGSYRIVELVVPKGYKAANDIIFTVDDFGTVKAKARNLSESAEGKAVITMYDGIVNVLPDDDDKHKRGDKDSDTDSVRTGDTAPLAALAAVLAICLMGLVVLVRRKLNGRSEE